MNRLAWTLSTHLIVGALIALPLLAFASDAGAPIANAPRAIGGTVFSGYMNETNTHMRLNVSVGNDAANIGGVVRTYVSVNGGGPSDVEIGTAYTILAGDIGTKFDVPDITISSILASVATSSLVEGRTYTFKKRVFEADNDPLSLVSLGTLTVALTSNHAAPSISNVYVGLSTTNANNYTFSTTTPSFEFVISNDSDLNTLTCKIDSFFKDDCFSYTLSGASQSYSYASTTRSLSDGSHTLVVVATDVFSQAGTSTVSFCVNSCSSNAEENSTRLGNGPPDLIGVVSQPTATPGVSMPNPPTIPSVSTSTIVLSPPANVEVTPTIPASQVAVQEEQRPSIEQVARPVTQPIAQQAAPAPEPESVPVETLTAAAAGGEEPGGRNQAWLWLLLIAAAVVVGAIVWYTFWQHVT